MKRRYFSAAFAVAIATTFLTSGFLHSIIPHGDARSGLSDAAAECAALYGYGHCPHDFHPTPDQHESALWSFIHSALSHEEKKAVLPPVVLSVVAMLLFALLLSIGWVPRSRGAPISYERQLARGVLPFRRFG